MNSKRFTSPSAPLNKSHASRNTKSSISPKRSYGGGGSGAGANRHLVVSHASDPVRNTVTSPSPQSAAAVQTMLNDLIEISQHLASYLEQEVSTNAGSSSNQDATLKAQEIERIVRRVEAYFNKKLESANAARKQLEHQVEELTALLQKSTSGNSADVEALRQDLLAEKRQRFQLEEQTQLMTEQHAKVVGTLERRLQKQEAQLRDLLSAIDRSSTGTGGLSSMDTSASVGTPRRLLRQQLAQHQETQRALEQYRQHIASNPMDNNFSLAVEELSNSRSESERPRPPLPPLPTATVVDVKPLEQKKLEYSPLPKQERREEGTGRGNGNRNGSALREVDEISAFLDNITKELEEIKT